MECLSYCIANKIDLSKIDSHYKNNSSQFTAVKLRELVKLSNNNKTIFIFKNGTVVSWGVKRYQIKPFLDTIKLYADKLIPFSVHDEVSYVVGPKTSIEPHGFFDVDCLMLETEDDELKLALSYGFSQSVKLQYFETIIEVLIEKYTPLFQTLSIAGNMPIRRKRIRQIIGEILGAKSEMNLVSNFLYQPKYFWQHPSLDEYYEMLENYLHVKRRVDAINHRLDTLNEIFAMFNSYLENKHAHILELTIIILIAIEIIFFVLNFHF